MAQLPPKIPSITQNWPSFPHQRMFTPMSDNCMSTNATATATNATASPQQQEELPSWVDEFLDFSSARRGSHRRSASDSIAFLDTTLFFEECGMFSDDIALPPASTSSIPSSPSEMNSNNDEKAMAMVVPMQEHDHQQPKYDACEVESSCRSDAAAATAASPSFTPKTTVDPKRVKRILANRQSAQRSRVRKLQYISELERSVTSLQTEVSALSPRVAYLDHQRLILNGDNSALKQRIAALAQDKIFKDAHQEALKKEIERLRQIYHLQKMGNLINSNGHSLHSPTPSQPQPSLPPHTASAASISALGM